MKSILRLIAILLMLACLLVLVPSGAIVAQAEILQYDLTTKQIVPPQKDGFIEEWAYEDPSISVKIETGRIYDTNYMVARVKLANATQMRSTMAGNYYSPSTASAITMAKKANAVFAINGDYFSARNGVGYTARMGKEYRNRCNGTYDVMVIDNLGDLHILKAPKKADMDAFKLELEAQGRSVINGYTFGPGLVINGERQTGFVNMDNAADRAAQRMCLAQVGPLEYLCIASEGPEDKGSVGLNLEQFSELVASFEGVQNAYNLDGGSSTTMVFQKLDPKTGKRAYDKVNSPNNPKRRHLNDIIYFASAWQPEK